jgi:hypothetical protein
LNVFVRVLDRGQADLPTYFDFAWFQKENVRVKITFFEKNILLDPSDWEQIQAKVI